MKKAKKKSRRKSTTKAVRRHTTLTVKKRRDDKVTVLKKAAMIEAMSDPDVLGRITCAVALVKIHRSTHNVWMNNDPQYRAMIEAIDIIDIKLDITEKQHFKNIKNEKEASTIFTLKTLGRRRGYSEQIHHTFEPIIPPWYPETGDDDKAIKFIPDKHKENGRQS